MIDERPPRYKRESVPTSNGTGRSMEAKDLRAASKFIRRRNWDLPIRREYQYLRGEWTRVK